MDRKGTISVFTITENTTLDLAALNGGLGVYHLTIRNRGNTTVMLNGVDDLKPDQVFTIEVPFAVINSRFTVDFLQTNEPNPQQRLVVWYGSLQCQ